MIDGPEQDSDMGNPGLTDNGDPAMDESTRSALACPRCGAHRLALLTLPQIDTNGYRPVDEIYGMINRQADEEPGIGCLAWTCSVRQQ